MLDIIAAIIAIIFAALAALLGLRSARLRQRATDAERRARDAEASYHVERAIRMGRDRARELNQADQQQVSLSLNTGARNQLEKP